MIVGYWVARGDEPPDPVVAAGVMASVLGSSIRICSPGAWRWSMFAADHTVGAEFPQPVLYVCLMLASALELSLLFSRGDD
jgi:hypothetical protein